MINASFTYFPNVTLQSVKLYCLKPSKLWRTGDFSLTHPSLSQIFLLSFLSSLFFSFFWMYFFALLRFTSIFSFQTNFGLSFLPNRTLVWNDLRVRGPEFASLYSLYSFHVSKTKDKKLKVEKNTLPRITNNSNDSLFKTPFHICKKRKLECFQKFLSTYNISICKNLVLTLIQYGKSLPFNSGVWKTFSQSEY